MIDHHSLGRLYPALVKTRHSAPVRIVAALPLLPSQCLRARSSYPCFAVDIEGTMGMGAVISHALRLCRYAEIKGLAPVITSSNPLYSAGPGEDCLAPYLGADHRRQPKGRPLRFRHTYSLLHLRVPRHMPLPVASRLLSTHFQVRGTLETRIDGVLADIPSAVFDLSLHYRGTDKVLEADEVSFHRFEEEVRRHVRLGGGLKNVFLATDNPDFERFVRTRWPETTFTTFNLGAASEGATPRHFSKRPPEEKAVEALVNVVLLGKAPRCIRTSSYLSAVSKILNPALVTVTLNRTFHASPLFPEREILAEEQLKRQA